METSASLTLPRMATPVREPPTPVDRALDDAPEPTSPNAFRRVLQDRARLLDDVALGRAPSLRGVALASFALTAVGGLGLGVANGAEQALASAIKLPAISLGALAVCFPALYVFSVLSGSRLSIEKTFRLFAVGLGLRGAIIAGLAPLLIFFSSVGSPYGFLLLAGGLVFGIAELGFMHALDQGIRTFKERTKDPINSKFIRGWMALYLLVLMQMTWSLRPVIGEPGRAFSIIGGYPGDGNMFAYFAHNVVHFFTGG